MKKFFRITATFLLTLTLLAGCSKPQPELTADMESLESSTESTTNSTAEVFLPETEADTSSYCIDVVYVQQIK